MAGFRSRRAVRKALQRAGQRPGHPACGSGGLAGHGQARVPGRRALVQHAPQPDLLGIFLHRGGLEIHGLPRQPAQCVGRGAPSCPGQTRTFQSRKVPVPVPQARGPRQDRRMGR